MTDRKATGSTQHRSTPGAALFLIAALVIGIAAAAFALRGTGGGIERLTRGASELLTELTEPHETPGPGVPEPAPAGTEAPPAGSELPVAGTEAPPPNPPQGARPRAATALQRIRDTVGECVPTLMQFAQGVRLIAADISPDNVDFIQESVSVPGRYVRMSCDWDGQSAYNISDSGRMVVPKRVLADTLNPPLELLPLDYLEGDSLVARVAAAAKAVVPPRADAVRRIELSFVEGHGVLARVQFEGQQARSAIVGGEGRILPKTQFFPQVERMPDISAEAAELGYRDQGQVIWSEGVSDMLDRLPKDYFDVKQRYFAISFAGRHADIYLPASGSAPVQQIAIDEYGDAQEPVRAQRQSSYCDKPFTYADARAALDRAIKARGESLAEFEQHDFGTANLDCSENAKAPSWRFGTG